MALSDSNRAAACSYPGSSLSPLSDVPDIVALDLSYYDEVCRLEEQCYVSPWSAELIRGEFLNEVSFRFGAVYDGKLVGYSFSHLVARELHVLNLAVAPDYRSRGFGRLLLGNVLANAANRGVSCAYLEVRVSNSVARRLYNSFGFRTVGLRRGYYQNNNEDALILELLIDAHAAKTFSAFRPTY